MLRGLYRFYLYIVFIAMLLFATFGIQRLLQKILAQTIFRDSSYTPPQADLVQAIVFAAVSLITAALFGGLHYWLIRRDMHNDPEAGSGGIRAFFLNFVQVIILPFAVAMGASAISSIGGQYSYGSGEAAYTVTFLGLWAFLEWERQRSPASSGVALVFQRLHLYLAQLILLVILTFNWIASVGLLVDDVFFGGRGSGQPVCGGFTVCQSSNLLSSMVAVIWVALFWLGYGFLSRKDTASLLRKVLHFISFGYGTIAILVGIYNGVSLLLSPIFHVAIQERRISYDVVSLLTLGLVVVGVYLFWLRRAAQQQGTEQTSVSLTAQAIAAALLGGWFWYGCGLLLLNILEVASPSHTPVTPESWVSAIALIVTGVGYIAMDILLRRRTVQVALTSPLRGFALALLGAGILVGAIGGATALYAYVTSLLSSPLDNWQFVAHTGLAAFIVGIVVVGLYLWTSIRAHFFSSSSTQQAPSTPPVVLPTTMPATTVTPIAQIVDELLAGTVTRDEAIVRIEGLKNN